MIAYNAPIFMREKRLVMESRVKGLMKEIKDEKDRSSQTKTSMMVMIRKRTKSTPVLILLPNQREKREKKG